MSHRWYYNQDGAQYGPVDEAEIIRLIQDGDLSPGSPVCPESGSDWQSARNHSRFQVMVRPRKKTPAPIQKPAATNRPASSTPVSRRTSAPMAAPAPASAKYPVHGRAGTGMASGPRHTLVYAPAPAPVAAVGSPGARLAWPWVTAGLVVLVGAVILIFALSLEERKPVPEEKSGGVETVNLPQDMGPSPGGPTPKTKATPPTPPAVNNPQVIRTYMENGRNFYFGQGGEILNYALAFQWFRKAADLGDPDGQYSVGVMYAAGKGVLEDDSEAVRWYHRAALQGHVAAQLNLGVHYSNGDGVIEDDAEAMNWLLKSALQGNANAQNNIGVMHQNGEGVPRNLINAYAWYNIAAANGHNAAMTSKMEVAALMPADQISRAQALSKALAARIKSP